MASLRSAGGRGSGRGGLAIRQDVTYADNQIWRPVPTSLVVSGSKRSWYCFIKYPAFASMKKATPPPKSFVHYNCVFPVFGAQFFVSTSNKYTSLIEQVFFRCGKSRIRRRRILMDFMSEAQQFTKQIPLLYVVKVYCYACK